MTIFKSVSWDDVRHRPFKKMTGQIPRIVAHAPPLSARARSPATRPQTQDAPQGPGQDQSSPRRKEDAPKTSTFDIVFKVLMALLVYVVSNKDEFEARTDLMFKLNEASQSGYEKEKQARLREESEKLRTTLEHTEEWKRRAQRLDEVENTNILLFWTLFVAGILGAVYRGFL